MNVHEPDDREELLASLILQYEQALHRHAAGETFADARLASDADLAARFDAAKSGLEALDRMRGFWSPVPGSSPDDGDDTDSGLDDTIGFAGTTLGRFRVQCELGRGGLGVVFLAWDPRLHRQVALKVPRAESLVDERIRRRFMREAAAAARLNHPQLVAVYEVGEDAGICYIAAEYCPGITLREWIAERGGQVPPRMAAEIMLDLSRAVQHAHGRGVLHRDIKPSNVLVRREPAREDGRRANSKPQVKLADFGVAKLLEQDGDHTRTGAIVGTLSYMAPEQAEGRSADVDIRADVYGLGAVLYELLTGRPPAQGDSDAETLRQLLLDEVRPPSRLRAEVPRDLEAICLKCLEKKRRNRYHTAQELSDDLDRFLEGRVTAARPLRFPETMWKWIRRRPGTAAVAALLLVSAAALFGTVIVYNTRLQTALDAADQARNEAQREAATSRRLLYSSDVRLAYEAYQSNNVVQVLEALDRQLPRGGEPDLRDFAWYYLRRCCEPETMRLEGHENTVFGVTFSPDGRQIATASQDGTARLWDAATGEVLHVLRGHADEVTSVAFHPDARSLASGSEDRTIRIWDAPTGQTVRILQGHQDHVQSVAFSPDGGRLASGSRDTSVRIWDAATAACLAVLDDDMDVIRAVAFTPAGDKLMAVDEAECLHVWSTADWRREAREKAARDKLFTVAISRDGKLVASGGRRMEINLWQDEDGLFKHVQLLRGGHTEWVQSLAFSPRNDTLASGGRDGVIQLWKPGRGTPLRTLLGHKDRVWSVAWSPDGARLASAGADKVVRIWNSRQSPVVSYPVVSDKTSCLAFSPDGSLLVAGVGNSEKSHPSADAGLIQVWNPHERTLIVMFRAHTGPIANLKFSPDGRLLASSAKGEPVKVWSRGKWRPVSETPAADVTALSWTPDSRQLAFAIDDTTPVIVDAISGETLRRFPNRSIINDLVLTPDGRRLVVSSLDYLTIWDIETGQRVFTVPTGHTDVAIASDGGAAAGITGTSVSLVELSPPHRRSTLVTSGVDANCVTFSPDGKTLAVAQRPIAISLWDRHTGHELARLECEARELNWLAFSPDGLRLMASGLRRDGKGGIWEWSIPEKPTRH